VILNLAVNARDAMPRGGELRISTASERRDEVTQVEQGQLPPGAYAVLRIADQGSGMDERTRRQIFEPFFTTKALGHGTGLGLATVLGIVSQSNGGIVVESAVGVGSVFTVLIPASDQAGPRVTLPGGPAEPGVHRRTILIVDDEASLRTVGSKILQRAGYHVLTAAGAEEALATLAAHPGVVDLLLTDVVMPKMSGVELAAAIKPRYPTLKVLFTSGYTDDTIIRHGIDGAQVEFLPKPYSLSDLTKAVQRLMPDADAAAQ
jgi:two-component system cell cycle sensor histidine kinase/response regulator CckA